MTEPIFYLPLGEEVRVFQAAREHRLPVLLKGPTGCGKSRFVSFMAAQAGTKLIAVACNEDTSAADLLGRFLLKDGQTLWQDGPVTRAAREGALLYLDEIAEAREDVVVLLHSLTDHRRELYLDKINERVVAAPHFQLVVSYNPGYQRGFKQLKPSTRQRFVSLAFSYPNLVQETEIIAKETGVELSLAKQLGELGAKIRKLEELSLTETVSTRLLVHGAKLIRAGLPKRLACETAILQPLSDDLEVLSALKDFVALHMT